MIRGARQINVHLSLLMSSLVFGAGLTVGSILGGLGDPALLTALFYIYSLIA